MNVGDLVKWKAKTRYVEWKELGIIIRCIPGTDKQKVVYWSSGMRSSYRSCLLEVIA
jgi:hypothetical protein